MQQHQAHGRPHRGSPERTVPQEGRNVRGGYVKGVRFDFLGSQRDPFPSDRFGVGTPQ